MDSSPILTAIKWTLIVFLAGFIGYFGKYLGKILIAKFHEGKSRIAGSDSLDSLDKSNKDFSSPELKGKTKEELELEKERLKLEKKKLKLQKKKLKIKEKDKDKD